MAQLLVLLRQVLAFLTEAVPVIETTLGLVQRVSVWVTGTSRSLLGDSILGRMYDWAESAASDAFLTRASVTAMRTGSALTLQDVLDAIAAIPAGGLTTQEHNQLMDLANGPDEDTIAARVWSWQSAATDYLNYHSGIDYGTLLTDLWAVEAYRVAWHGVPLHNSRFYSFVATEPQNIDVTGNFYGSHSEAGYPAQPDWSLWLATDTPYSFLNRTQAAFSWSLTGPGGVNDGRTAWKQIISLPDRETWLRSNFTEIEATIQAASSAASMDVGEGIIPSLPAAPPVWPGDSLVTLGTPAALVDGMEITGPMSGLIFAITGEPARFQKYDFGDVTSYSRVGQVIFATDDGAYERSQTFAIDTQIIVPVTMAEAASAIVRLNFGWTGTVRTWIKSA